MRTKANSKRNPATPNKQRFGRNIIRAAERRAKAWDLRLANKTYEEIGRALGVTTVRAYQLIEEQYSFYVESIPEKVEKCREVEIKSIQKIRRAIWPKCMKGSTYHIDCWEKLSKRLAKLQGLDLDPNIKVQHGFDGVAVDIFRKMVSGATSPEEDEMLKEMSKEMA